MAGPESEVRREPKGPAWSLRRGDQPIVVVLLVAAWIGILVWWVQQGGPDLRWLDATPRNRALRPIVVDVNAAAWSELVALPGVGEVLARRIVESRSTDGPFHSVDDLTRVRGIGEKTLENLRPYLVVVEPSDD